MRISFLFALVGSGCLMGCGSPDSRTAELKSHLAGSNLVIVAVNSLAAAHTTPYGYERNTTPALSLLAEESVRFADVSAGSSNGFASVTSLFRGEAVEFCEADRLGEVAPASSANLAKAFRAADYRVFGISTDPTFREELGVGAGFNSLSYFPKTPGAGVSEAALELFDQYLETEGSSPFLLYVQLGTARTPREPNPQRAEALLGERPDPSAGELAYFNGVQSAAAAPTRVLKAIDSYDAVVHDVDFAISRFVETLNRTDHLRDTLFIVTGVSGQAFGQRGNFGTGHDLYQEQIAVPLVIRLPDAHLAGLVVRDPVALYDLFPTLVDLFNLDVPPSHSGSVLTLLMTDDWHERQWPVSSKTVNSKGQSSMRMGHFKLIEFSKRKGAASSQLLNLERDKLETSDHGPQRPETKSELARELNRFREAAALVRGKPELIELPSEVLTELSASGFTKADFRDN